MRGRLFLLIMLAIALWPLASIAQNPDPKQRVRTVTIPISIFTKKELRDNQAEEYVQADRLIVHEDKDEQQILSIRSVSDHTALDRFRDSGRPVDELQPSDKRPAGIYSGSAKGHKGNGRLYPVRQSSDRAAFY